MTASWSLRAWPTVLWQATSVSDLQFVHLGTRVLSAGTGGQQSLGQTLWGRRADDVEAGVAWDWVQLMPGVVAMVDPMSVVTNIRLLSLEGEVLTAWEAARHLNDVVHNLPWQKEVDRALSLH